MARPARTDASPARRMRGFEPAAAALSATVQAAGARRGFAVSRLLTHWPEVVGADIAARCRPVRIARGRQGLGATLTLLTTGAQAPMLSLALPLIRDKVNACCGWNAVARVVLTQTAAEGFGPAATPAPRPLPTAADRARAEGAASGIHDDDLAAALRRLALNFHMRPSVRPMPNRKA